MSRRGPFRHSLALYRWMLHAYPVAFRERFGGDMTADFEELLHRRGAGLTGRLRCWKRILTDLARSMPRTRCLARSRASILSRLLRGCGGAGWAVGSGDAAGTGAGSGSCSARR